MSEKYVVNIVSEQTIPNILYIKELHRELGDSLKFMFVTTERMEQDRVIERILNASGVKKDYEKILVKFDDFNNVRETLSRELRTKEGAEYFVNLTGGTKLMSLAVFESFRRLRTGNTVHYDYIPINENCIENIVTGEKRKISTRLTVKEFLAAYGYKIKSVATSERTEYLKSIDEHSINTYMKKFIDVISGKSRLEKEYASVFRQGYWFELYMKKLIEETLILNGYRYDIMESVSIVSNKTHKKTESIDNELDIVVALNNRLYIIECKSAMPSHNYTQDECAKLNFDDNNPRSVSAALYKLAAVIKDKGLVANGILATLNPCAIYQNSKTTLSWLKKRANLLRLNLITLEEIRKESLLIDSLKKFFNIKSH